MFMKLTFSLLLALPLCLSAGAQETTHFVLPQETGSISAMHLAPLPKLKQRNYGTIIGLQKGHSTFFELGGEMHWRKIGLKKPQIWGATTNLEYSFSQNVIGYKVGVWRKQGRINFIYGANLAYFSDFKGGNQIGLNPTIGFRLMGLHLTNGINLLAGDMSTPKNGGASPKANTIYISLRYYFPLNNTFVWDRKDKGKENRYGLLGLKKKEKKGLFGNRQEEEKKGLFGNKKEQEPAPRKRLFGKKEEPTEEPRKGLFGNKRRTEEKTEEKPKGLRGIFSPKPKEE